jgi:hypothetical protein
MTRIPRHRSELAEADIFVRWTVGATGQERDTPPAEHAVDPPGVHGDIVAALEARGSPET